jgi:hypothetical protein
MSQPRGFGLSGTKLFANIAKVQEVELNFIVDSTNGNGLGVRSIKSNGYVQQVFMNTSASFTGTTHTGTAAVTAIASTAGLLPGMPVQTTDLPAGTTIKSVDSSTTLTLSQSATTGHSSATITYQGLGLQGCPNPNPAAGLILIQFKNNFNYVLSGSNSIVSPIINPTTAVTSGLTSGAAYVITSLGTTTLSEWQTIGLPQGLTPTVGQSFIVPPGVTGTGGSHTGKVGTPSASGIMSFETVGDPNQSANNANIAQNGGAYLMLQALAPVTTVPVTSGTSGNAVTLNAGTTLEATGGGTVATTTTMTPTAPANGSVLAFRFRFDGSSVSIPDGGPSNSSTSGGL